MLKIPCRNFGFPKVIYGNNMTAMQASSWQMQHQFRFFSTNAKTVKYIIFRMYDVDASSPAFYDNLLKGQAARCGLQPAQLQNLNPANNAQVSKLESMQAMLQKAKGQGAVLVVLVIRQADRAQYALFKNLADRVVGLQSVCIVERLNKAGNFFNQYMQNISMKINLKLGGINHTALQPNDRLSYTMILGADLIHPSTGSIAAVVGSVDATAGKCLGSVRLQPLQDANGPLTDQEVRIPALHLKSHRLPRQIIYTMEDMAYERLLHWAKFNNSKLPNKIIYYRDGISSGHYVKVKDIELKAIHSAYAKAHNTLKLPKKDLQLTALIVTKRHHTRFYVAPGQQGDRWGNRNTLPGTSVDKFVTSPFYQDFFLQSHSGIKGTAKPTHYFVIEDGIPDLNLEKLRGLVCTRPPPNQGRNANTSTQTHKLCYSYCRATMGVSYASPTYYADRLCERAAIYVRLLNPVNVPRRSLKECTRNPDGSEAFDPAVETWFNRLECRFYPHRDVTGVPVWGMYAPWAPAVAETMFWM